MKNREYDLPGKELKGEHGTGATAPPAGRGLQPDSLLTRRFDRNTVII